MPEMYEIVIRNETNDTSTPIATEPSINGESSIATPIKKKSGTRDAKSQNALVSAIVASDKIKPYVQQVATFGISQIEMTTGSSELQRKMQAVSAIGSSASGIVTAGIVGGIGSAATMAAVQLLQTVIQTAINQATINNQKIIENENLQLARSRAGMVSNKSRGGGTV